jgi:GGDEF domain-containing protein
MLRECAVAWDSELRACWDWVETAVDLVDRADSALYRAKAAGRDRLVQAPRIES